MCGIAGIIDCSDGGAIVRMAEIQRHRGPDDGGVWESRAANVGLGSRRLAIVDLSPAGHMPMQTSDGKLTIVYNGEIYNYPELRRDLEGKGYTFKSRSDTEAILYLYQESGAECVRRLNGMYAIAIWDEQKREMFLGRDHFGIKPLYYYHAGQQLAFASEIKALLELPEVSRQIDFAALNQYLTFLWVPEPHTLFEGIRKLPAGHYAVFRDGRMKLKQFWDLRFPPADYAFPKSEQEIAEELRERFCAAVRSQLRSDVPLGAFLSAGLDSSSIVGAMAHTGGEPVRTFTIAFPAKYRLGQTTLDDTNVARRTASHFGCRHKEIVVEPNVVELLPKLIWHMDEPVADPAILTSYLICREARKDVTVLLSGIGGDELFAGYRKHRAHKLSQRYQLLPMSLRRGVIEPLIDALPSLRGTPFCGYMRLAKKMGRSGSLPPRERFITDSVYLNEAQKAALCSPGTLSSMGNGNPWAQHLQHFERVSDADYINQMLYLDIKTFMPSLNLLYNDKMSMASSVEVRVPFLDWPLSEWVAWNIPPALKIRGSTTKYILREAMRSMLPAEVLRQRKAGFGAPIDQWLAHDLRPMTDELLNESAIRRRGLFEPHEVRKLIEQHRTGRHDWSYQLWQLLTLEIWMQTFLDSHSRRSAGGLTQIFRSDSSMWTRSSARPTESAGQ
jgi:asparagine synthase (glutamine-hydrolysing)